jgi:hypothetical protein
VGHTNAMLHAKDWRLSAALSKNYRLGLQKFPQSVNSAFPTDAGLLVAAEWRKRIVIQCIDEHASGLQLPRHATGPFWIG